MRIRGAFPILTMWAACSAGVAQTGTLYVANQAANSISVIDASRGAVVDTIRLRRDSGPTGIAVTPDGARVFVTEFHSGSVEVIDASAREVIGGVELARRGGPMGIAITPDGGRLYVANRVAGSVSVIDAGDYSIVATIALGPASGPSWIAMAPDGSRAYVTNSGAGSVAVIDTATNTVAAEIRLPLGSAPMGIAVAPDGGRVYVANTTGNSLAVIDAGDNSVAATIGGLGGALGLAASPDGRLVYVTCSRGDLRSVAAIDTERNAIIETIPAEMGPMSVVFSPDGETAWVANSFGDAHSVSPIRVGGGANPPIAVGAGPVGMAVAADAGPKASLSPAGVDFGNVNLGSTSGPRKFTLSSAGTADLANIAVSLTGSNASDFSQTNTCGVSLKAGAACTIAVTFKPSAAGSRAASVSVASNAGATPLTAALSGTGVAAPKISLDPGRLNFGSVSLNSTSAAQTIKLTNPGTAALTGVAVSVTGTNAADFKQTNNCPASIAPAASCAISVTFTPSATGSRSAMLSITGASSAAASLSGVGVGVPKLALTPASLSFGGVNVGSASAAQTLTLNNSGTGSLDGVFIRVAGANPGDFSQTSTCGTSLAAGANCTISAIFKPREAGNRSATLSISGRMISAAATAAPLTAALAGTGLAPKTSVSPSSLNFGTVILGASSAVKTLTLNNSGTAALGGVSVSLTGANPGDFSQSNNCPASLAAAQFCTISVTFKPTAAGTRTASVSVANTAGAPLTAALAGTGLGVPKLALSPTSLTFPSTNAGTATSAQKLTLSNSGTAAATGVLVRLAGANAGDFSQTNTCAAGVAIGASCAITVIFKPVEAGARTATVMVAAPSAGTPLTASLTGTGVGVASVALSPAALSFGNVNVGSASVAQRLTLTNTGTGAATIASIAVSGTNLGDFPITNGCRTSIAAHSTCAIYVTFKPAAAGGRTATVSVTTSAAATALAASLTGTGVAAPKAVLSANRLNFGTLSVGATSAPQTLTLGNSGTSALTGIAISLTGANAGDFAQTNTCGTSLAAGANCTISVTFKPTAAGLRAAAVNVANNATPAPLTAGLSGAGVAQ